MFNYYQPFLFPFLGLKAYQLPDGISQLYYHSAEDALWDIFKFKKIKKGGVILVPSFYCIDVVENMANHGLKPVFYDVDEHFQISVDQVLNAVRTWQPVAIIFLHASGITCKAFNQKNITKILRLAPECMIIEDCVHRLVDPSTIKLLAKSHIVIDSLRKVSPLPGSFTHSHKSYLDGMPQPNHRWSWYQWSSLWWFGVFRIFLILSHILNSSVLNAFAHEVVLKRHDDIIGDSFNPPLGLKLLALLHRFFNFKKIQALKHGQTQLYLKYLRPLLKTHSLLYEITVPQDDWEKLHVYPLGLRIGAENSLTKTLIKSLHERGMVVWAKFPDTPWSKENSVLYLPLGFHIREQAISAFAQALDNCLSDLEAHSRPTLEPEETTT